MPFYIAPFYHVNCPCIRPLIMSVFHTCFLVPAIRETYNDQGFFFVIQFFCPPPLQMIHGWTARILPRSPYLQQTRLQLVDSLHWCCCSWCSRSFALSLSVLMCTLCCKIFVNLNEEEESCNQNVLANGKMRKNTTFTSHQETRRDSLLPCLMEYYYGSMSIFRMWGGGGYVQSLFNGCV